jgi:hypothetical protein
MGIKRYIATADNTITNAFNSTLTTRGTGSNMGASDILEVFSIYGQTSSSAGYTTEESRILIDFPISSIYSDRFYGYIPNNGSVNFFLKLYNADHSSTTPTKFSLIAPSVSASNRNPQVWTEGFGLDMDEYTDEGVSNWIYTSTNVPWVNQGGDFYTGASDVYSSQYFEKGTEDLEVNVTNQIENYIDYVYFSGQTASLGFGILLSSSNSQDTRSYYTKKFFGRESEFQLWRPHIEARWNSQVADDRGNFYISSSLLSTENVNTIYLYNYKNGKATNIPSIGQGNVYVKIYETLGGASSSMPIAGGVSSGNTSVVTGGWVSTGIYSASFAYTGSASTIYDVWYSGSNTYHTGTIYPLVYNASDNAEIPNYVLKVSNAQQKYYQNDKPRFRLFIRQKDWSPTIYTVASTQIEPTIIENTYYRLFRIQDNFEVVPYGTASSTQHTLLSFDVSGNYFDFDMSILEKGYMYGFKFAFDLQQNGQIEEQPYIFKFRVEE